MLTVEQVVLKGLAGGGIDDVEVAIVVVGVGVADDLRYHSVSDHAVFRAAFSS